MNYECISVPYVQQKRETRTSVSPVAAMARNAASGTVARNVDGIRLRGTTIADTQTSASMANQMAAKRIWTPRPRGLSAARCGPTAVLAVLKTRPWRSAW